VNEREAARSKGISTGRYVLYNKYKDLENDLSLEDAKDADVNVLIKSMLDVASEERNPEESPKMTPTPHRHIQQHIHRQMHQRRNRQIHQHQHRQQNLHQKRHRTQPRHQHLPETYINTDTNIDANTYSNTDTC